MLSALGALVALLAVGLAGHEVVRLYEARAACARTQAENALLLQNAVCADPFQRLVHGPKQDEACRRAEEENRVGTLGCAWKLAWREGAPNQLWERVTGSYWLLFGILAPAGCVAVAMCFWSCGQRAARAQTKEMQLQLLDTMRMLGGGGGGVSKAPKPQRRHHYDALPPIPSYYSDPQWTQFLAYQQQQQHHHQRPRVELLNV